MNENAKQLREKIQNRTATVGVLGLGYVGLPLLRAFFDAGFPVLGFDVDPAKIDALRRGENYLKHLGEDFVRAMSEHESFAATSGQAALSTADALILCVPTPLGKHQEPDLSYVEATCETIRDVLRPGQLVSLESTTYPGTTTGVMKPILDQSGFEAGSDYFLAYSPEREDPGRQSHNTQTIPKLVGGFTETCGELATALYGCAVKEAIRVESCEVAEAAKLFENIYRAVNIALANEMKTVLTPMGIDVWKVIEAASTKPFGFQAFWPGPGLGGHCIPIDPFYLTWKAREYGQHTRFIELAGEVNTRMPQWVKQRVVEALNHDEKPLRGSRVLILGLAYKPDVDDVRETPSAHLIELFKAGGAHVDFHDPLVDEVPDMREHPEIAGMKSVACTPESLATYDVVVISTNHSTLDYEAIAQYAQLVVDTRGAMRSIKDPRARIVQA